MSPQEYNDRLFVLIERCVTTLGITSPGTHTDKAKRIASWCKALIDAWIPLCKKVPIAPYIGAKSLHDDRTEKNSYIRQTPREFGPLDPSQGITCATEGCLNACLTREPKEAFSMGWHKVETEPAIYYCHDCAAHKFGPPQLTQCDQLDPDDVAIIFKAELGNFLERAKNGSKVHTDQSFLEFLLAFVEPVAEITEDPKDVF